MSIPTTRSKDKAIVSITPNLCIGCGKCLDVCKDYGLELVEGKIRLKPESFVGCIGCGHCMAICPAGAITVLGRTLAPDDVYELPLKTPIASYDQLLALLRRRRSIREFTDIMVETDLIEKILTAAKTSPMGIPPSDVNVLVFDSQEKNRSFAEDYVAFLKSIRWCVSNWFLLLMRPFWGKANDEVFREFVRPLFDFYISEMEKNHNVINYDAPLAMYFYGSPYSDPADPIVAATTAMYAAESLGLGTCMLGGIHPLIQFGSKGKRFRQKHNILHKSQEGIFVIFGYPSVHYQKSIHRTFATVHYAN